MKFVHPATGEILAEAQPGCSRMAFVGCTYHCG
jgi:hypothetical protein